MSIKSSLEIVQKLTQLYVTGFSLNSIYNSTYLKALQEASSIRSKPREENNYYDKWLSFSAKGLEVKLKSREFTSLLSQYINFLMELRTILIELGYPVYYLESLFYFYMRNLVSFAPMRKENAPFEVLYKKGKTQLLHYLGPKDSSDNHTPLLILYAPINRFHIMDISQEKSVVRKLMSEGLDVYLLDWGYPSWEDSSLSLSLDDYVNYVQDAVHSIKNMACVDKISILGYCWGGIIALIYAARNNENLRSLTLMAAPIDSSKDNTIVANWARSIDADSIIHEFGYIDGMALDVIFIMRNPTKYLFDRYLKFFSRLHDEQYVNNFIALQRWLSDTPPIPGNLYLKIIDDCYRKNLLVSNTMQFDGESIDLSKITVPLLSIVAEDDDLASPESTLAVASYVSCKDKLSLAIPGDHIGLCISTIAHKKLWPEAAKWILSR
jgi:polyhydroxyalkanoate synthase subunit PhaC